MMNRLKTSVSIVSLSLLTACGGGGSSSNFEPGPSSIENPDDAAAFLSVAFTSQSAQLSGKKVHSWHASAPLTKELVTENCDAGFYTYDDESGRYDYSNCRYGTSGDDYELINGVVISRCADDVGGGPARDNDCEGRFHVTRGVEEAPLVVERQYSRGTRTSTRKISVDSTYTNDDRSESSMLIFNGNRSISIRDDFSADIDFQYTDYQWSYFVDFFDQYETYAFNGTMDSNLGEFLTGCANGSATYETTEPLWIYEGYSGYQFTNNGEILVTDSSGNTATAVVDSIGLVVTVNGESQTYYFQELVNRCQF